MINNDWKLKPLTVNPAPLNFGTLTPGSIIPIPVLIRNPNDKPVIWRADKYGTTWLILDETTSTGTLQSGGQKEINVTVNSHSIPDGNYTATLTFTVDSDDESASVQIPVFMGISPTPNSSLQSVHSSPDSPLNVSLSLVQYLNSSQSLPLAINNKDNQNSVNWTATITTTPAGGNWLTLDRYSGTLTKNERQTLYVTANTNSLQLGQEYPATLSFTVNGFPATQLDTLLHVNALPDGDNGPHAPIVKPDNLDFDNPYRGQQASFQVTSDAKQKGAVKLSIDNNGLPWLNVDVQDPNTPLQPGDPPRTVTVTVDPTTVSNGHTYKTDLLPTFDFDPKIAGFHHTPIAVHIEMTVP
jgi:hypothetical protein